MSTIISYNFQQVKDFMQQVTKYYDKNLTEALPFEEWKALAYPNMYNHPEDFLVVPCKYGEPVRVAASAVEMMKMLKAYNEEIQSIRLHKPIHEQDYCITQLLKEALKPVSEVTLAEPLTVPAMLDGTQTTIPIWFNTTMKSVNVRLGFNKLDSAKPGAIPLSDGPVHMMLGGITGGGKSVALNDIICSLLLEYPPWELQLVLADFKIVELSRYANRIPTPHVSIVAATKSTEFALSTFNYIIEEMNARQALFTDCGVQNIRDFRKKFNLCLPRLLFIADEFVQMFENIKVAEQEGNDKASEQKQLINSAISAVARLGRSSGIHMLLSSQNLDGVMDEQTAGQFGAGATLAATPSVSTTLIGNPAGATIRGKGKAYVNLRKVEKRVEDNILVRVPYIDGDDPPEEEAAKGKLSYLQELLKQMHECALACNYDSTPYYYNENDLLPRELLRESLADCVRYYIEPNEGDELSNTLYQKQTFARIPLGREVAYTKEKSYPLNIMYKKFHNLLIHSDDSLTKTYIANLVGECLRIYAKTYVIAVADEVLYHKINLEQYCGDNGPNAIVDMTGKVPSEYIKMVSTRKNVLNAQNFLVTKNKTGEWDDSIILEYVYQQQAAKGSPELEPFLSFAKSNNFDLIRNDISTLIADSLPDISEQHQAFYVGLCHTYSAMRKVFSRLTDNFSHPLTVKDFDGIVVWWLGADNFSSIGDYESRRALQTYLAESCQVGIFNVVIPSLNCSKLSEIAANCNFVLEKCSKQFFMDVDLPRNININANSYQIFDRELGTHNIVRFYS